MKYFFLLVIFLICALSLFIFLFFKKKIQKQFIKAYLSTNFPYQKAQGINLSFFSELLFEMVIDLVFKEKRKTRYKIFDNIKHNNRKQFELYLKKQAPSLAAALFSISDPSYDIHKLSGTLNKDKSVYKNIVALIFYESTAQYQKLLELLKQNSIPHKWHIWTLLFEIRALYFKTDLQKASQQALKVLKKIKKRKFYLGLSYCYFMLGEIYRTAQLYDVSHMMFLKALSICQQISHLYGQRLILAHLGLICLEQQAFEQSKYYFDLSKQNCLKEKDNYFEALLLNQQALLERLQSCFEQSFHTAQTAIKMHQLLKKQKELAFAYEQSALAAFELNLLEQALHDAQMALNIYKKEKNEIAMFKIYGLLKQIYFIQKDEIAALQISKLLKKAYNQKPFLFDSDFVKKFLHDMKENL